MKEKSTSRLNLFPGVLMALGLTGCASSVGQTQTLTGESVPSPAGAWVSSEDESDCMTQPITYFASDGTVLVFLSENGDIHSFGQWRVAGDTLSMTHNDFPLDATGMSNAAVELDILQLDGRTFTTRNGEGEVRFRTRCSNIELDPNGAHTGH
ncbi:MAG: hypothetical protein WBG08_05545 [Litorimonas sp.]